MTRIVMSVGMERRAALAVVPLRPLQARRLGLTLRMLGVATTLFGAMVIASHLAW